MQAIAVVYAIIAWLACWLVDLIVVAARVPVGAGGFTLIAEAPLLKLLFVLLALVIILVGLAKHRFLLNEC